MTALHRFYARSGERVALAATAVALFYGGGIATFWLHAVHRREAGPPIADVYHWFLDGTLGFVALTPVLAVLVPIAARLARGRLLRYALVLGLLFTAVTAPGPFLHNIVAGGGTPLADVVTEVVGTDGSVRERVEQAEHHSAVEEGLVQVLAGLPTYTVIILMVEAARRRVVTRQLASSAPMHTKLAATS